MLTMMIALAFASTPPADRHHHQPAPAADQRAADLREGKGMGMAVPAERNGYPGPRHVLELADKLALTPDQHARTKRLFDDMAARARRLGAELLVAEAELDRLFEERRADRAKLDAAVRRVAQTEAALKLVHLETHLDMTALLSPEQVARYVALRRAPATAAQPAHH